MTSALSGWNTFGCPMFKIKAKDIIILYFAYSRQIQQFSALVLCLGRLTHDAWKRDIAMYLTHEAQYVQ